MKNKILRVFVLVFALLMMLPMGVLAAIPYSTYTYSIDGEVLASIHTFNTNVWETYTSDIAIPDGIGCIYITYRGSGLPALRSFTLF